MRAVPNHLLSGSGCHESLLHSLTRGFGKAVEFVVPQILLISGIFCLFDFGFSHVSFGSSGLQSVSVWVAMKPAYHF